jgi:hypothetical protein
VPLGVQLIGFEQRDEELMAHARWLLEHFVGAQLTKPSG